MRAVVQDKYGVEPADVLRLEQIDRPQIGEDDVLVRVHAASVHIGDWHVMTGQPLEWRELLPSREQRMILGGHRRMSVARLRTLV